MTTFRHLLGTSIATLSTYVLFGSFIKFFDGDQTWWSSIFTVGALFATHVIFALSRDYGATGAHSVDFPFDMGWRYWLRALTGMGVQATIALSILFFAVKKTDPLFFPSLCAIGIPTAFLLATLIFTKDKNP